MFALGSIASYLGANPGLVSSVIAAQSPALVSAVGSACECPSADARSTAAGIQLTRLLLLSCPGHHLAGHGRTRLGGAERLLDALADVHRHRARGHDAPPRRRHGPLGEHCWRRTRRRRRACRRWPLEHLLLRLALRRPGARITIDLLRPARPLSPFPGPARTPRRCAHEPRAPDLAPPCMLDPLYLLPRSRWEPRHVILPFRCV
jgi:hypothetical protein